LGITRQSALEIEQREKKMTISLKLLRETADALDMDLVYGLIPREGSLKKLVDRKALHLATEIVLRTSNTMELEDQGNSEKRIKQAIKERTEILKNEMPKILWD
jgi:predicted DNA-binding mobile mystery protein A